MHFNSEERQVIDNDFKQAVELLIDMATKAQLGEQEITFHIGYQRDVDYTSLGFKPHPKLRISEKEISLCLNASDENSDIISLYKKGEVCYSNIDQFYTLDCLFLREFPRIKEKFSASLQKYTNNKESFWERFIESHKRNQVLFDEVVVDLPESIDQQSIELEEKDGKKIGTINFGERSIRIITSGNIVFESQTGKSKVKKK